MAPKMQLAMRWRVLALWLYPKPYISLGPTAPPTAKRYCQTHRGWPTRAVGTGLKWAGAKVFIPNENMVYCPERTLTQVLDYIFHFF